MDGIRANPAVRRRLFFNDDVTEQAKVDNFSNVLQESITRDRQEKSRKWNFDFDNEKPLNGLYEWSLAEGPYDWVGKMVTSKPKTTDLPNTEENVDMRVQNEVTPKVKPEDKVHQLRKRRSENGIMEATTGVRRRISFD